MKPTSTITDKYLCGKDLWKVSVVAKMHTFDFLWPNAASCSLRQKGVFASASGCQMFAVRIRKARLGVAICGLGSVRNECFLSGGHRRRGKSATVRARLTESGRIHAVGGTVSGAELDDFEPCRPSAAFDEMTVLPRGDAVKLTTNSEMLH